MEKLNIRVVKGLFFCFSIVSSFFTIVKFLNLSESHQYAVPILSLIFLCLLSYFIYYLNIKIFNKLFENISSIEYFKPALILVSIFSLMFIIFTIDKFPEKINLGQNKIVLSFMAEKNINSKGVEAWITSVRDGKELIDLKNFSLNDKLKIGSNNELVFIGHEKTDIEISNLNSNKLHLNVIQSQWAGKLNIINGSKSKVYDLYSATSENREIVLNVGGNIPVLFKVMFGISYFILFNNILLFILFCIYGRLKYKDILIQLEPMFSIVLPLLIQLLFFLAFYPGVMTPDSFEHWDSTINGVYNSGHPLLYPVMLTILVQFWNSVAIINLLQIIVFVGCIKYSNIILKKINVSIEIRVLLILLLSISPAAGILNITVWKDILYSLSLFILTLVSCYIIISRNPLKKVDKLKIPLIIILTFIGLIRFNGIVIVLISFVLLVILYFVYKIKSFLTLAFFPLSIVIAFNLISPLIFNINITQPDMSLRPMIHQIAAVIAVNGDISESEYEVIEKVAPISFLARNYYAGSSNPIVFKKEYNMNMFEDKKFKRDLMYTWLNIVVKNPKTAIIHSIKLNSIAWNIDPTNIWRYASDIMDNPYGIKQSNNYPELKNDLTKYIEDKGFYNIVYWSPALWMYLSIFFLLIAYFQVKSKLLFISIIPMLSNVLSLIYSLPSQDFRYYYANVLIGPFLVVFYIFYCRNKYQNSNN